MTKPGPGTAYRGTLLTALAERCQRNPRYSQRAFARDLGMAPHRISEILRGRQGLSGRAAEQVARRLGLDAEARRAFIDQVAAAHARSPVARAAAAARLERRTAARDPRRALDAERFKSVAEWPHLALLEAMKLRGIERTPQALGARLGLAPPQADDALRRLEALGLVRRTRAGRLAPAGDNAVGGEAPSAAVRSFHAQYLEKAKDALVLQPFEARDFNTAVLAIDGARLPELKRRLEAAAQALLEEFEAKEGGGDAVYALTLHAFRIDHQEETR